MTSRRTQTPRPLIAWATPRVFLVVEFEFLVWKAGDEFIERGRPAHFPGAQETRARKQPEPLPADCVSSVRPSQRKQPEGPLFPF